MKCYCCSGKAFEACCQPYLTGKMNAPTAEALMRSRYTAFCLKNMPYILKTQHPSTRQEFKLSQNKNWAENSQFKKLTILRTQNGSQEAEIEFVAELFYKNAKQEHVEVSQFLNENGIWYYLNGRTP